MGIFASFLNKSTYETGANYQLGHSISSSSIANIFGNGGKDINVLEEYNGYVWKAMDVRAEELSGIDFYVERKVGDKWQKDDNHEFNTILDGQDGGMSQSELKAATQISLDMYGEAFWYYSKGESSRKPFAIYLLDPSSMTVMVADNKRTGYVYQKDNQRITFDLDEIDHFIASYNPNNPYRGAGPMQKAGWFIKSNRYIATYVNNYLEGNGIPAGVVVAKEAVNDKDWSLFKRQWASNYGGIDNAGKTAFVRGQELEFIKTGLSLGEVDFEKLMHSSREDILAMFSMPKSKLGIYEDFNKASSQTSDMMFAKTFTKPAVKRIEDKVSRKIAMWYGPQFRLGSDFSVPEDREQKLAEFEKGTGVWITVNEAREAYGLPTLGKEFDILMPKDKAVAEVAPKSIGKVTIRTKNTKAGFSYEMKESFRSKTEDLQVKFEQAYVQATNPILEEQKAMIIAQINPKKAIDTKFDVEGEAEKLDKALTPLFMELAAQQGALAIAFAANDLVAFELSSVMKQFIRNSVAKANLGFTKETQELVAAVVAEGLQAGDSIAKISGEIGKLYDDVLGIKQPGYRLERISRTEVIKASNAVTEAAYRQSGVVNKKEWFANPGHCQFCASLNGSVIQLGATFVPQGGTIEGSDGGSRVNSYEAVNHPPIHPQCRCTLIPVIEG